MTERPTEFIVDDDATQRKRAEEALCESEERFRRLVDLMPIAMYTCDAEGQITSFNEQAATCWGRKPKIGTSDERFCGSLRLYKRDGSFLPHDKTPMSTALQECRSFRDQEVMIERPDGSRITVLANIDPIYDASGTITGMINVFTDITESKRAQETLINLNHQQAVVAELGQSALVGIELNELMEKCVDRVAETMDVEYCKVLELFPDGEVLMLRAGVGWRAGLVGNATVPARGNSQAAFTLLANEPVIVDDLEAEERFQGPPLLVDHDVVSGMSVVIRTPEGIFGVLGAHTTKLRTFTIDDINFLVAIANLLGDAIGRKQAEQALRESEKRFRHLFDHAPISIWEEDFSAVGRWMDELRKSNVEDIGRYLQQHPKSLPHVMSLVKVIHRNPSAVAKFEAISAEESPATHSDQFHESEDRFFTNQDFAEQLKCVWEGRNQFATEFDCTTPKGNRIVCSLHWAAPVVSGSVDLSKAVVAVFDITERKKADQALKEREHHFRLFSLSTGDCFWNWDMVTGTVERSSGFERIFGYQQQEVLPSLEWWLERIHPEDKERVRKLFKETVAGEQSSCGYEYRFRCQDGSYADIDDHVCLIRDATGKVVRALGAMRDVTGRKRAEEEKTKLQAQVRHTQKMKPSGNWLPEWPMNSKTFLLESVAMQNCCLPRRKTSFRTT